MRTTCWCATRMAPMRAVHSLLSLSLMNLNSMNERARTFMRSPSHDVRAVHVVHGVHMGVTDLRYVNQRVPIADVARALDLRVGSNGNMHCWRPECITTAIEPRRAFARSTTP